MQEKSKIKDYYNKKYSIITYSGTLAIESVLKTLELDKKDNVLISSLTCYSVLEAVINAGLNPVIITPNNGFLYTKEELEEIFRKENIKVYIAVHQYGYYQEFPISKDVVIIEDYSQAWNITKKNGKMNYKGDYIIQSFGKTKPLSYGIGGIICSNKDISKFFDLKERSDRSKDYPLLEYIYPLEINEEKLMNKGYKRVAKARKFVSELEKVLNNYEIFNLIPKNDYNPSYHRYVVRIKKDDKDKVSKILDESSISYQYEYKVGLNEIPLYKKYNKIINNNTKEYVLLLIKTDNSLNKIKKLKKLLELNYEKKY